jgi:hypothetical protein
MISEPLDLSLFNLRAFLKSTPVTAGLMGTLVESTNVASPNNPFVPSKLLGKPDMIVVHHIHGDQPLSKSQGTNFENNAIKI